MDLLVEALYATFLFIWVVFVTTVLTRRVYDAMVRRGLTSIKAIYYNRKIIHMAAGGLVSLLVPFLFKTPYMIVLMVIILAILTYIPHRTGELMYWFQTSDNMYEVHYIVSWGLVMVLSWIFFNGNWWYGVVPVAFMSFGDGVTGIVRNKLYNRRTKAWAGNIAMAIVTIPIGYIVFGLVGALAGALASLIEHYELKPFIDDNLTVPLISFIVITIGTAIL